MKRTNIYLSLTSRTGIPLLALVLLSFMCACSGGKESSMLRMQDAYSLHYRAYLEKENPVDARSDLNAIVEFANEQNLEPYARAFYRRFAYERLLVMDIRSKDLTNAESDRKKLQYWIIEEKKSSGGINPQEMKDFIANFNDAAYIEDVDRVDKGKTGGAGPRYLQYDRLKAVGN